ncbi:MAG: hypothetical protein KKC20_18580 [Proteobacteria bacterium]|nr:hypothetical protein [Pseudomonadota bacterium]
MRKWILTLTLLTGIALGVGTAIAVTASLPMPPADILFTRSRMSVDGTGKAKLFVEIDPRYLGAWTLDSINVDSKTRFTVYLKHKDYP